MVNQPLVSIIINNYNYARFLRDAIDSALNQTYDRTETIVVDDGSTDNSREIIAGYGDRIIPVLKENGGQNSAFDAGFAASAGVTKAGARLQSRRERVPRIRHSPACRVSR